MGTRHRRWAALGQETSLCLGDPPGFVHQDFGAFVRTDKTLDFGLATGFIQDPEAAVAIEQIGRNDTLGVLAGRFIIQRDVVRRLQGVEKMTEIRTDQAIQVGPG